MGAATFIGRFLFIAIKQLLRLETVLIRSSQPNYEKAAFARNGRSMPATL
ncbi:MAG: hypothetical protein DI595_05895 [Agrobacterium fabrum]|uniref:Uncharacterized protein n=1 Tax=Agrobacterium fabrum TaxID=1176649 RepID=A0A2W5H4D6_9HYPH|nr:MAG: hypothetical protein DI595_05895 [Agrobacterium fabrum]